MPNIFGIPTQEEALLERYRQQDAAENTTKFIEGLDNNQLAEFRSILQAIEGVPGTAPYLLGQVDIFFRSRNVCVCGKDHEGEAAEDILKAAEGGHSNLPRVTGGELFKSGLDRIFGKPADLADVLGTDAHEAVEKYVAGPVEIPYGSNESEERAGYEQPALFDMLPEDTKTPDDNRHQNAETWGVTFDDENNLEGTVTCKGCGSAYQTLDDRMRREPGMDGCHFCQLKSAHG